MSAALPRFASLADQRTASTLTGLMSHLDAVYAFAHALTGDLELAADLTERVYRGVSRDLWSTLGGHTLRDRLLARCLTIFNQELPARVSARTSRSATGVHALLAGLPVEQRAAISLVDLLGLSYAAGAAVLGTPVEAFRESLHRGRDVLVAQDRASDVR